MVTMSENEVEWSDKQSSASHPTPGRRLCLWLVVTLLAGCTMTTDLHQECRRDIHDEKEFNTRMKALIIYDSQYGNTERIAQAISDGLTGNVKVVHASEANPSELKTCDLLILGSPTHGGYPTESIYGLLKASLALEGVNVAAFDTRTKTTIFGYAAPKIAKGLQRNGGILLVPPEGFIVLGIHGPLKDGELERAKKWAQQLSITSRQESGHTAAHFW